MTPDNAADAVPAAERWELEGHFGPESWLSQDGRFLAVELGSSRAKKLSMLTGSFELEQLRLRQGLCSHKGPWPFGFSFCPECGARLAEPPKMPDAESWSAPFGMATGLPVLEQMGDVSPVVETRRQENLPARANLGFIVAGAPPALFAYDLASGMLRARRESDASWQDLEHLPRAHNLPRWSWAAAILPASGPAGFAIATNDGPVMVHLAPDQPLSTSRLAASFGVQAGLGGPACVEGRLVMPVRTAGGLALACLTLNAQSWTVVQVPGPFDSHEPFAAPVVHYSDAFWCGSAGLLSVCCDRGELTPEFRPWGQGLSPALAIRPLQSENGTLYQLMRRGDQDPVFHSLVLPKREAELRDYRLCFSTGNAVFADGRRRRLPWEEAGSRGEFPLGDDEFVLPLLAFSARRFLVAICAGRSTLTRFIDTDGKPAGSRACRLYFSPATKQLVSLDRRVDVEAAWDIVPFVFRRRLYIYAASRNDCWSWALHQDAQIG